jgi:peptidoglycan/xylan/chitin deacetylase (PgdA/CDA1 family)
VKRHLQRLVEDHGLSARELAEREICGWDELKALRVRGVEIGCHTVSHALLLHETPQTVRQELAEAQQTLETELGCAVRHLAYPYGKRDHVGAREFAIARELGFASAVTTRKGALFAEHAGHPHALPRVEVTPSFAGSPRYMQAILSGLPLLLWNRGRFAVTD